MHFRFLGLALLVMLAGCASPNDPAADPDADGQSIDAYPYGGMTEYCLDNETCDFWDLQFHEGAVYEMDTLELEAIVLPVPGADPEAATLTARQATAAWQNVTDLAEPWFADAFRLRTFAVGIDIPDTAAITDPEIVVVSEQGQRSTSIGLNAEQVACSVVGEPGLGLAAAGVHLPGTRGHHVHADGRVHAAHASTPAQGTLATRVYPVHEHDGMAIFAADCITGGFRCVALNFAGALGGSNALYDLVAHEVGHCLGASHVGDALDFNARYVPEADIMAYADNPSRVSCPSSLNARVLEGIYAHLADQPVPDWLQAGGYYAMDPWDYVQVECPLPPQGPL